MGIKNFLMRKLIERRMKDVPEAQRDIILAVIEENPALFEKIAKEVKEKTKPPRQWK